MNSAVLLGPFTVLVVVSSSMPVLLMIPFMVALMATVFLVVLAAAVAADRVLPRGAIPTAYK